MAQYQVFYCDGVLFVCSLPDSVRAFKEKMKMGEFKEVDPETQKQMEMEKIQRQEEEEEKAASIAVGSR